MQAGWHQKKLMLKERMLKRLASKKQMRHLACKERMLEQMLKTNAAELIPARIRAWRGLSGFAGACPLWMR